MTKREKYRKKIIFSILKEEVISKKVLDTLTKYK